MTDFLVVFCSCSSEQESFKIANALIEKRLAACVTLLPAVQSVYRWEGKVNVEPEQLLLIKTTAERFSAVRDEIHELHSYEVPEILALPVFDGAEKYLTWLRDSV